MFEILMHGFGKETFPEGMQWSLSRFRRWRGPKVAVNRDYFSIGIFAGPSPMELAPLSQDGAAVLTAADITDLDALYVADPFMVRQADGWYLFFEILPKGGGDGVIGVAFSSNELDWEYQGVVLREPFHLSYPCVFQAASEYFMIPESTNAGAVRLYRAERFPDRWEFVANLMDGVNYVDCTPIEHGGLWWLFAGGGALPLQADTLRLFYADSVTGPWCEHPQSPIIDGNIHIARPGGRVIAWNGNLLRFTQDCSPWYGFQVHAFEIIELSKSNYVERPVAANPVLKGSGHGWNAVGMHHIDCHRVAGDRVLACVDGWHWGKIQQ